MERCDSASFPGGFLTAAAAFAREKGRGETAAAATAADRRTGKDSFQEVAASCTTVLLRACFGCSTVLLILI